MVTVGESDKSYKRGIGLPPYDSTIEATLTAYGDQTVLIIGVRGMPLDKIAFYYVGRQIHSESLAIHVAGASVATSRRAGRNSSLSIRTWLLASLGRLR
jgi:hypothetical protein